MTVPSLAVQVQGQGSVSADNLNTYAQTTNLVTDLRSFIGITGIEVLVRGLAAVNDGSGGIFYWNAGGVGPDDGVNTIVPNGAATGVWSRLKPYTTFVSTRTVLITGTALTYLTPPGARQLYIRMIGGGGGGAGTGTSGNTSGSNATVTVFNGVTANLGGGGSNNVQGGQGGTAGTGTASFRLAGSPGGNAVTAIIGASTAQPGGGEGGGQGGGLPASGAIGGAAVANTGAGGAGAGAAGQTFTALASWQTAGGGGQGEYVEIIINTPAVSYTYTVGTGGLGGNPGTSGFRGGAGASGYIIVDEYY